MKIIKIYTLPTENNYFGEDLPCLKKGGIHIKKKNRGKFTEYCGGEVTDACIKRAKASGNPKLVKRAVFAENARKWKQGGLILKAQFGTDLYTEQPLVQEQEAAPDFNSYFAPPTNPNQRGGQHEITLDENYFNKQFGAFYKNKGGPNFKAAKYAYNKFINYGMAPKVAAVFALTAGFESGWHYNMQEKGGSGYGLIQFTGPLQKHLRALGLHGSLDDQIKFIAMHYNGEKYKINGKLYDTTWGNGKYLKLIRNNPNLSINQIINYVTKWIAPANSKKRISDLTKALKYIKYT